MKKTKVLFLAAELTPLVKVGGLADVAGALPPNLKKLGVDIRIALPYYQKIKEEEKVKTKKALKNIKILPNDENSKINIYKSLLRDTPLYLLENNRYLSEGPVYSCPRASVGTFQEFERFLFFSISILKSLTRLRFVPDIIHCNDWHTAAVVVLLKSNYFKNDSFKKIKTLYTIHNLGPQGAWSPEDILRFLDLTNNPSAFLKTRDKYGNINLMQQGILNADLVNTVSPTYAKEILNRGFGGNLVSVLKKRSRDLYGILNGTDPKLFSAAHNPHIKQNFTLKSLKDKKINKLYLQKICRFKQDPRIPLIGSVGRAVWQKGTDLTQEIIPRLDKLNCQFVLLTKGNPEYEKTLKQLTKKYSKWFRVFVKLDTTLAIQIYSGADMFVIPSRYEPCGLAQMISMSNATIPIVRATGGLKDTVTNYQAPIKKQHTGFVFKKSNADEFLKTIKRAIEVYAQDKKTWTELQKNGMRQDLSWDKSAKEYLQLYKKLLKK